MSFLPRKPFDMIDVTVEAVFNPSASRSFYNIAALNEGQAVYFSMAEYRARNGADRTPRQMENSVRSAVSKCRKETGRAFKVARYVNDPDDGFMVYRERAN